MSKLSKYKKIAIVGSFSLIAVFLISFKLTDIYLNNKNGMKEQKNNVISNNDDSLELSDKTKISLFREDKKEKDITMRDLKYELGLEGEVTEEVLSRALKEKGYELENISDNELIYSRDAESSVKPNKYYINEYKGYLAIFKSDDKGNLEIENAETDIFNENKRFEDLPVIDREQIKNLEREFNTKEEAEDGVYELIS